MATVSGSEFLLAFRLLRLPCLKHTRTQLKDLFLQGLETCYSWAEERAGAVGPVGCSVGDMLQFGSPGLNRSCRAGHDMPEKPTAPAERST